MERYTRQSFLGATSQEVFETCVIGIIGLGGGGSHIIQQLAHIGFTKLVIYDDDVVEETNLNRLIGAKSMDVLAETPKLHIAKMMILGLLPHASIEAYGCAWQEKPEPLRKCHIIFGAVDTFQGRSEIEAFARRYMINYIDIGMDVHEGTDKPLMTGQVILSMPGFPCMRCLGFLTEERLAQEAAKYGATGGRPQVVWPNGLLASLAVGIAVDILTDWSGKIREQVYMDYDAGRMTVSPHPVSRRIREVVCPHYPESEVGPTIFRKL